LIVVAIVGLLASQSILEFTSPRNKIKASVMSMRADFTLARAEAINRNTNVRIDCLFNTDIDSDGDADDGYRIWIDDYPIGSPDGVYTPKVGTVGDNLIKEAPFVDEVEFYDVDLRAVGGPNITPAGASLPVVDGVNLASSPNNYFNMRPDGTADDDVTVYMYIPGGATGMKVAPYAVEVSSSGRIRIRMWKKDSSNWDTR
jgi:Type II transport protein GspH